MQSNKKGVEFTNKELRCLRAFGSKEPTDRDRFGVNIFVQGNRVYAQASNGHSCVQLDGPNDGHKEGNWFVFMGLLIDARKLLEKKQVASLKFSNASLRRVVILENSVARNSLEAEADAALSQVNFPIDYILAVPSSRRDRAHCVPIAPAYLKSVISAAEAVSSPDREELVEWFSPPDANGVLTFRVGAEQPTTAIGIIKQGVTAEANGPADPDDDEDEDPKPKRGRKNGKQQELPQAEAAS